MSAADVTALHRFSSKPVTHGSAAGFRVHTNCPVPVWLDQPLGDRKVIDYDSGDELALYVPRWAGNGAT